MADLTAPSRDKLRKLFPNHDDLVAFERLFDRVGDIIPNDLESTTIDAGLAGSQAVQALATLQSLKLDSIKTALELLFFEPQKLVQTDTKDIIEPTINPINLVESDFTVKGNLDLPKKSGFGLKVDNINPTFGWRDLLGGVGPRLTGAARPALSVFRGGSTREFAFTAGDGVDLKFHVPHDYAPGTDLFFHVHWAHNGTVISGSIVWDFFTTYSKGHNQSIFPVEKNLTLNYPTVNIATTPRYRHRIDEIRLSVSGGSATEIDTDLLEPDGVILMRIDQTTIPTITGGSPNEPFLLFVNIHYQSTGMATKQRTPDFYT